jgi:hypothetical protein
MYSLSPRGSAFSALEDQECAGALMWTVVTIVYLIAGTLCAMRLLTAENLRQRLVTNDVARRGKDVGWPDCSTTAK